MVKGILLIVVSCETFRTIHDFVYLFLQSIDLKLGKEINVQVAFQKSMDGINLTLLRVLNLN